MAAVESPSGSVLRTVIKEIITSTVVAVMVIQMGEIPIPPATVFALAAVGGLSIGAGMWALGSWTRRWETEEVAWWGILLRFGAWAQLVAIVVIAMIHNPTVGMLCLGILSREAWPTVVLPVRRRWRRWAGPARPESTRPAWAPQPITVDVPAQRRPVARTGS